MIKKIVLLFSLGLLFAYSLIAQENYRKQQFNVSKSGLALQGYDPVAYFKQNKAIEGKAAYTAKAEGIVYHFSTVSNRDLFVKNYKAYEPEFGGWCAYAMGATSEKVEIDPETFKIVDGKLYLFYHSWSNNTLPKWNKDEPNLKAKAEKNWKRFIQ